MLRLSTRRISFSHPSIFHSYSTVLAQTPRTTSRTAGAPLTNSPAELHFSLQARTMSSAPSSSSSSNKCEWLVILPDQPDALERRLKVRPCVSLTVYLVDCTRVRILTYMPATTSRTQSRASTQASINSAVRRPPFLSLLSFPLSVVPDRHESRVTSTRTHPSNDARNPGAFFASKPEEGKTPSFKGSVMLAEAETEEEVVAALKRDVYTTGEVWDWSKVQIMPFKSALRVGM